MTTWQFRRSHRFRLGSTSLCSGGCCSMKTRNDERVDKVFTVIGGMRKYLICENESAEHAATSCYSCHCSTRNARFSSMLRWVVSQKA